jgi:hypothetical protein
VSRSQWSIYFITCGLVWIGSPWFCFLPFAVDHEEYDMDEVANSVSQQGAIPFIIKVLDMHSANVGVGEQALAVLCLLASCHGTLASASKPKPQLNRRFEVLLVVCARGGSMRNRELWGYLGCSVYFACPASSQWHPGARFDVVGYHRTTS